MRKLGLAAMFVLATSVAALAQSECSCLSTPFKPTPPCFEYCTMNLLESASMSELQTMLGISPDTAVKIMDVRAASAGGSLDKYRLVLSSAEFKFVVNRINSLSTSALREFRNSRLRSSSGPISGGRGERTAAGVGTAERDATTAGVGPTPSPTPKAAAKRRGRGMSLARPASAGAAKTTDNAAVEAINRLEEERNRALVVGDVAAIDALYADDYTSAVAGTFRTKAEVLADLKSGVLKLDASSNDETNVRVYGNTAVVTGKTTSKVSDHGADTSGQSYFTRVYVNQNGRWQLVANHTSRLTP